MAPPKSLVSRNAAPFLDARHGLLDVLGAAGVGEAHEVVPVALFQFGGGRVPNESQKFAALMRVLCERNGGTFVGLTGAG